MVATSHTHNEPTYGYEKPTAKGEMNYPVSGRPKISVGVSVDKDPETPSKKLGVHSY
jgi:hypothetical protein